MGDLFSSVYCKRFEEALSEYTRITKEINPNYSPQEGSRFGYTTDDRHYIEVTFLKGRWEHETPIAFSPDVPVGWG